MTSFLPNIKSEFWKTIVGKNKVANFILRATKLLNISLFPFHITNIDSILNISVSCYSQLSFEYWSNSFDQFDNSVCFELFCCTFYCITLRQVREKSFKQNFPLFDSNLLKWQMLKFLKSLIWNIDCFCSNLTCNQPDRYYIHLVFVLSQLYQHKPNDHWSMKKRWS